MTGRAGRWPARAHAVALPRAALATAPSLAALAAALPLAALANAPAFAALGAPLPLAAPTAALADAAPAAASPGAALVVEDASGRVLAEVPLGAGGRWCLVWNHSVTGIEVRDCFRTEGARMVLESSRQPDYAAGLGESPGVRVHPDGAGGYLLQGLERPVPPGGLVLRRAGPAVNQRIAAGDDERPLPEGRRGERLVIRPAPAGGRADPEPAPAPRPDGEG